MTNTVLEDAFFSEIEKIARAQEKKKGRDWGKIIPAVAALGGGAVGAASPKRFSPKGMFPHINVNSAKGRFASGVLGASASGSAAALPGVVLDGVRAAKTKEAQEQGHDGAPQIIEDENGDPAVKIIGASIDKLDEKRAVGVPIVQPPPGYVYNPELGAFAPNSDDPGWLTEPEAMQAQQSSSAFQAGAQQASAAGAQREADSAAQSAMMQQVPQPGQAPGAPQQAPVVPVPPTPGAVMGDHPMAQGGGKPQANMPKAQPKNSTNSVAR